MLRLAAAGRVAWGLVCCKGHRAGALNVTGFTQAHCAPSSMRPARRRFGVGDDVSDWKVESVALSGKRSNESFVFQVGWGGTGTTERGPFGTMEQALLALAHAAAPVHHSAPSQLWSAVPSAPSDLLPLSTPAASRTITPLLPGGGLRGQQPVQMVFLKIRVSRFW